MTTLVRWEPFRDLTGFHGEVSRLMNGLLDAGSRTSEGWAPALDVWETESEVVYAFDVPGVREDQIAIEVQKYGVCKVNIDTDLRLALTAKIREVFATKPAEFDPRNYLGPGREAIISMVRRKLHMLASAGKAEAVLKQWEKLGKPLPNYYKQIKAA